MGGGWVALEFRGQSSSKGYYNSGTVGVYFVGLGSGRTGTGDYFGAPYYKKTKNVPQTPFKLVVVF